MSPGIAALIAIRVLQGLGRGRVAVAEIVIVKDLFDGRKPVRVVARSCRPALRSRSAARQVARDIAKTEQYVVSKRLRKKAEMLFCLIGA